jgi:hypothetical protein
MPQESMSPRDEQAEPTWSRRAVEDEAEEGLLLAEYATRMRLKNRIIVDTLTASGGVDTEAWADEVRLSLGRLRIEAEVSARRMGREHEVAVVTDGRARHQHDYRQGDADALERRQRVYRLVARRLLSWENSDEQVFALLDAARSDAAEEMDAALTHAVEGDGRERVTDEAVLRERLRLIVDIDLPALERASEPRPPVGSVVQAGRLQRLGAWLRGRRRGGAGERGRGPR